MPDYVSTNIRLPREQLKQLKHRAVEEGKSMGQVFREVVTLGLGKEKETFRQAAAVMKVPKESPFAAIIGLGKSDVPDGGVNHDKYLYGKAKSEWKR